ncbi:MAG: MBL fold metallo-hydrolase [Thermoplasmataceae archaeon]
MKISDNVTLIDRTMANCYDVSIGEKHILIDAGTKGSAKKIISFYRANGIKPEIIFITHYHPDHMGGLKILKDTFNPEIFIPDAEVSVALGKSKIIPVNSTLSKLASLIMKIQPVDVVKKVSEAKIEGIITVKTPGHTPGSTSYYLESDDVLFVGDALTNKSGKLVINKSFTLDMEMAKISEKEILNHKFKLILPGHGKPFYKKN